MKYTTRFVDDYLPWICGALLILWITNPAMAWTKKPDTQKQAQNQKQTQKQSQVNRQKSSSYATAKTSATASNEGIETNTTNVTDSEFYALSLTFPNAVDCFSGVQGGDKATFLGFHILNNDCWAKATAMAERDAEVRALLKCGGPQFRKSIAYQVRGKRKQQEYCVDYMTQVHRAEIAEANEIIELRRQVEYFKTDRDAVQERCDESNKRVFEDCQSK